MEREEFERVRERFVGGDVETQELGSFFRGPVKSIELDGDTIQIVTEWTGVLEDRQLPWKVHPNREFSFPLEFGQMDSLGRLIAMVPMLTVVIFPLGGSKLDPSRVEGLELSS